MNHFRGLSTVQVYICKNGKCMQPTISEALGNCHSALRRGIQCIQPASFVALDVFWIPRRSAELKVAVKAMTITDSLTDDRKFQVYMLYYTIHLNCG